MEFSKQKSKTLARRSLASEFEFNKSATTFESSKKKATSTFHLNNTVTGAVADRTKKNMFATMRKTTIRITKKLHSSLKKIESVKKLEKFEKPKSIKRSPKILRSNEEEISKDVIIWEEQFCKFKHLGTF